MIMIVPGGPGGGSLHDAAHRGEEFVLARLLESAKRAPSRSLRGARSSSGWRVGVVVVMPAVVGRQEVLAGL